jgi:hypothetical protein
MNAFGGAGSIEAIVRVAAIYYVHGNLPCSRGVPRLGLSGNRGRGGDRPRAP